MKKIGKFCALILVAAALWATGLGLSFVGWGGRVCEAQRQVWVAKGTMLLSDYYMPWKTAHEGYAAGACKVEMPFCTFSMTNADRTYPALAMLPHRLLPFSLGGAVVYSLVGFGVYLLALMIVSRGALWPLALALSAPVVFSLERGNPIWFAAAACAVFLAWWDSDEVIGWRGLRVSKKYVAVLCLAVASVLKISPAMLAVLYLRRRDWKSLGVCVVSGLVLFVVPFLWFGGIEGLAQWLHNAGENGRLMSAHAAFGFYPFARVVKILLGMDWHVGVAPWRWATQLTGFGLLFAAWRARSRDDAMLLAVIGFMFAAGNMMFYGALYLLPVLVLRAERCARGELLVWFALLCPLQLPVMHVTANHLMAAAALVGLACCGLKDRPKRTRPAFWYNNRHEFNAE